MRDLIEKQKLLPIQTMLRIIFGIVPIVAGIDKFTNFLVDWTVYISPLAARLLPLSGHSFMMIVGVIEIAAGIVVIFRPKLGSIIVSAWLVLIALNLITTGHYFDIAVRDLVMAVGAFTLYRITSLVEDAENVQADKLASIKV